MFARDIMTTHPSMVARDDTIAHAAEVMRTRHLGILPVIDDLSARHLVGVITDRDVVARSAGNAADSNRPVAELMTTQGIESVHLETSTDDVITLMRGHNARHVMVLDARERVVGVIARTELYRMRALR